MQFVHNGPDIPERLLQMHEEGRVVFFTGAGISKPAGLDDFACLVAKIYKVLNTVPSAVQQAAIKAGQFDTAISLLEAQIVGGRETVRRGLASVLTPNLKARGATATHEALLTLSKCRAGQMRLITTNFDRLFETVIENLSLSIEKFQAPLLPVPKNRWDGLVYLHGLLGVHPTPSELDRLVLSSGDFGLAYLTEGWAARFVSELFRNYTVCFVGYSINDPVLRYMMDALAADRLLGESPPEMFAFGSFSKDKEDEEGAKWRAKNVTPILYRMHKNHTYLHKTLHAWSSTYRDGVYGKERIVNECASARPLITTKQDYFVARMLWALSDREGLPAKRFAEHNPVPSLDWLVPFSEERYGNADLVRFGVTPEMPPKRELAFSLIRRPTPYTSAARMCLVDNGIQGRPWDKVMSQLARWLVRHLGDPELLLWLVKHGAQPHESLSLMIEDRIKTLVKLEGEGNAKELAAILEGAPNAVPSPPMRNLWHLLLSGRVSAGRQEFDLFRWLGRFQRDGLTTTVRLELREILAPRVALSEPFRWQDDTQGTQGTQGTLEIKDLVEWEIKLSANYVHSFLQRVHNDERWLTSLPDLLDDFSSLLRDVLDLMCELGGASEQNDLSHVHQPSIDEHPQNRGFRDWTALIDLTRDAWRATASKSPERAALIAESWLHVPYPVFRRLAFFAAAQGDVISTQRALDWLLADECWWLWSGGTLREAMRLMVYLSSRLDAVMLQNLVQAVLAGPPRTMFKADIDPEHWTRVVDHMIWLRLAKINEAGAILDEAGQRRLRALTAEHPEWRLAENQRDEFSVWLSDGSEWRKTVTTPRRRSELIEWLKNHPNTDNWQEDDWYARCIDSFKTTAYVLYALSKEGVWPEQRWRDALQAWKKAKNLDRSWQYMAPVLAQAPDVVLQTLAHVVSWWLHDLAKTFKGHEQHFFTLAGRVLDLNQESDGETGEVDTGDPFLEAMNHPVGLITKTLIEWWSRNTLEDGQGLPGEIKPILTRLCDTRIHKFRHGRMVLASHVITLFRVDREWTQQNLLGLFDWQNSEIEAKSAWEAFLGSPRLYQPLMVVLKPAFLETAQHYAALESYGREYAELLTIASLDPRGIFTSAELAMAANQLPPEGLNSAAQTLVRELEVAGDQRAEYWRNRIVPYFRVIWPKTRDKISPNIAENLGLLCVEADKAFPEALAMLRDWLTAPSVLWTLMRSLRAAELCDRFPEQALEFLSLVAGDQPIQPHDDLRHCLAVIQRAAPQLENDVRYRRLSDYLRLHE